MPPGLVERSLGCREGELAVKNGGPFYIAEEEEVRNRLSGVCGETVILKWEDRMQ